MTAQDYPKLPLPMYINLAAGLPGRAVVEYFTADQMRAYVDADRALRVPDADPPQEFIDYMARNYYGDVVFSDSAWHARAIWKAAIFALKSSQPERKPIAQRALRKAYITTPYHAEPSKDFEAGARFAEAFHGITGEKP